MDLKKQITHTVLLVDDDVDLLLLFKESLENLSFTVVTASSGLLALEYLKKNKVDCLISDINMPSMSGAELAAQLIELGFNIPLFFITGYYDYPREELNKYKARAIIFKPFDFEEAATLIKSHLKN